VLHLGEIQKLNPKSIRHAADHFRRTSTGTGGRCPRTGPSSCKVMVTIVLGGHLKLAKMKAPPGANVFYNMPGSRGSIPIIRGKACNPLARCFPALQLACRPVSQPLSQPSGWLPSGRLENPINWQGLALHKLPGRRVSSAKRKLVAMRPPSPDDIHDVTRRARNPSPHGTRRAICVCGRCSERCPGWVAGIQGRVKSEACRDCNGLPTPW
jgi:hypothetical protein